MYWKWNYHLKELYVAFNDLFAKISTFCSLSYTLTTHTCRQVEPITSKSTLGEQIKYYRSIDDIKQTDLGIKLNFHRSTLNHLENKDMKLINVELIKGIIEELNIQDKININDEYISFLLDNPCDKIIEARQKLKEIQPYSIGQASRISGVSPADIMVLTIYIKTKKN